LNMESWCNSRERGLNTIIGGRFCRGWRGISPTESCFRIRGESRSSHGCCGCTSAPGCKRLRESRVCCGRSVLRNVRACFRVLTIISFSVSWGRRFSHRVNVVRRLRFFGGCVAQVTFSALNEATIRVLMANGCEVVVPRTQVCCGALASHAGVREAARDLARRNLKAFAAEEFDAILTNAAGCGSTLKEYSHLFSADEPEYQAAKEFESRVRDVTEFLETLGMVASLKPTPERVTYQDSCHLLHGQRVREAPRTLLRAIPELELVELPYSDICCGSAGVYNITQTEASLELLAEKMRNAASTQATTIITANPGCLLQMRAGAELHKTGQQVLHVMELLDRALE